MNIRSQSAKPSLSALPNFRNIKSAVPKTLQTQSRMHSSTTRIVSAQKSIASKSIATELFELGLFIHFILSIKELDVDQNIVDKSVLQSHEGKKLGIFLEEEANEEEDEQYGSPLYIIQRLLYEDEGRYSFKDNQSSGSKSRKSSVDRQDSITSGWSKIRDLTRRNTYQNQLSLLKTALIENEMEEKAEFEDGTPLARMKLANRQINRSKFDTINFDGPQYKFDLKE